MPLSKILSDSLASGVGQGAYETALLHVREEQASGTAAGTKSTGTETRTVNTVVTNEITNASLSSNQITLPSGTYYLESSVPSTLSGYNQSYLYNTTDSSFTLISNTEYHHPTLSMVTVCSEMRGRFTISAQKVFEIRQYSSGSRSTNGMGAGASNSQINVFTDVQIWKVA
jgi:hypothetical protein